MKADTPLEILSGWTVTLNAWSSNTWRPFFATRPGSCCTSAIPRLERLRWLHFDPAIKKDGAQLAEGYLALQAESHPTEFRKIEVLDLSGCMDPKAANYKSYYIHRDDVQCK
jgi:hypothetical protein